VKSIEQLSIFLENRPGRLREITHMLTQSNASIRTLQLVEAGDFGILRLILKNTLAIKNQLNAQEISAKITRVFAVEIADKVDCFHRVASALDDEGIDIEYTYVIHSIPKGAFVIKTAEADIARAVERLERDGIKVLDAV